MEVLDYAGGVGRGAVRVEDARGEAGQDGRRLVVAVEEGVEERGGGGGGHGGDEGADGGEDVVEGGGGVVDVPGFEAVLEDT